MKLNYILTVHDDEGGETFSPYDTYSADLLIEHIGQLERWRETKEKELATRLPEEDEADELTPDKRIQAEIDSHLHAAGIQVEPPLQTDTPD